MSKLKDLRLNIWGWQEEKHPVEFVNDLGITYQIRRGHSMGDFWQFWNCENVPDELPNRLSVQEDLNPLEWVGYDLSQEEAEAILERRKQAETQEKN